MNNKAFALYTLKKDKSIIDVSWNFCITEYYQNYLNIAFRSCIALQIIYYKNNCTNTHCEICLNQLDENTHIDHIKQFSEIIKDFCILFKGKVPTKFDEDKFHSSSFSKGDIEISSAFYDYHLKNANLRMVCAICNLKRKKNVIKKKLNYF